MSQEDPKSPEFKVVDKRGFHVDGTPRESDAPAPAAEEPGADFQPTPEVPDIGEEAPPFEPASFETLVVSLSTTAMFQLGLLTNREGKKIPSDLPNARRTIDMLALLKEKTRGNLTEPESKLLSDVLYELQMNYVAAAGQPSVDQGGR